MAEPVAHRANTLPHAQLAIGDQASQGTLKTDAEELEAGSASTASPRFGHNLSRISIYPPAAEAIQTKLEITQPGDVFEQEAERVSEQVMRMPEAQLQRSFGGGRPKSQTDKPGHEHERLQIQRVRSSDSEQIAVPPIVHEVLSSPGQPLDKAAGTFMESRFMHDFSRVRVHADAKASESARSVNALAYTVGRSIVFGAGRYVPHTEEGRRLLAHELTHVVQQTGQDQAHALDATDPAKIAEAEATETAGAVLAPRPITPVSSAGPQVARQPKEQPSAQASPADRFIETLERPPPGNLVVFQEELWILAGLSMQEKFKTLEELRSRGFLDRVISRLNVYSFSSTTYAHLWAAIYAVKWTSTDADKGSIEHTAKAAAALSSIEVSAQNEILDYLKAHSATAEQADLTAEGISALIEGESDLPVATEIMHPEAERYSQGVYGGAEVGVGYAPPSIIPNPFTPGNQPVSYYIGNEAHAAIAQVYNSAHLGDVTFYNRIEMSTLLGAASRMGVNAKASALTGRQLGLKPDITNLTKQHLYEIKPVNALGEAIAESKMYIRLLNAAGVPMSPGPTTEDGTRGAYPAPGGVFIFASPAPGAIVYRYRRGQSLEPERVKAAAGEPARARWRYVLKPEQKAAIAATAAVGTALIILVILLSPLGI